jgi:hypothetical protein
VSCRGRREPQGVDAGVEVDADGFGEGVRLVRSDGRAEVGAEGDADWRVSVVGDTQSLIVLDDKAAGLGYQARWEAHDRERAGFGTANTSGGSRRL